MDEAGDPYAATLASLRTSIDLLERLRAEPPSPKRDAAIEQLCAVMISALSALQGPAD